MKIREVLETYPEKIAEEEYRYLGFQQNKEDCEATMRKLEADITKLIEDKSNTEEYKKEISNATKRAFAVKQELNNNKGYKELLTESKSLTNTLLKLKIDISRLKREFRSAETLGRL